MIVCSVSVRSRVLPLAAVIVATILTVPGEGLFAAHHARKEMSPSMAVTKGGIMVSGAWARASAGRARNRAWESVMLPRW